MDEIKRFLIVVVVFGIFRFNLRERISNLMKSFLLPRKIKRPRGEDFQFLSFVILGLLFGFFLRIRARHPTM